MSPRAQAYCPSEEESWVIFDRSLCEVGSSADLQGRYSETGSDYGSTALGSDSSGDDQLQRDPSESTALQRFSGDETLIIFDWDDTLLPTSWLEAAGLLTVEPPVLSQEQRSGLARHQKFIVETLTEARTLGQVIVITNAVDGWVEASCSRYLPIVVPLLEGLMVLSARSTFQSPKCHLPSQWKAVAFEQEVHKFCEKMQSSQHANIVSIGDSNYEHKALLGATVSRQYCHSKSVKLIANPTVQQLSEQQSLIAGSLWDVAQYDGDLDVDVGGSIAEVSRDD